MTEPLLDVRGLAVAFPLPRRWPWHPQRWFEAVRGIDLRVAAGEVVALVGESGCGKSTTARAIARLIDHRAGTISLAGTSLHNRSGQALRDARRPMQMVFQDPGSSLDPRWTAAAIIAEPMRYRSDLDTNQRSARVDALLVQVGLDPAMRSRYPHEFSGGQRQRLAIARALAAEPQLLICDEPVSALDVSVQAQIVNLLDRLRHELGLGIVFIAHDLAVVRHLADRVAVLYAGQVVETGPTVAVFERPQHPYTRALLASVPEADPAREAERRAQPAVAGEAGSPPRVGCRFAPRCALATDTCRVTEPTLTTVADGHNAACPIAVSASAEPAANDPAAAPAESNSQPLD